MTVQLFPLVKFQIAAINIASGTCQCVTIIYEPLSESSPNAPSFDLISASTADAGLNSGLLLWNSRKYILQCLDLSARIRLYRVVDIATASSG